MSIVGFVKQRLTSGSFARSIVVLISGTAAAQAISFLVTPVLTRVYEPTAYGAFAVYTSLATVVAVVATGRYDLAIMLPRDKRDAFSLSLLSAVLVVATGVICLLAIFLFGGAIAHVLGAPAAHAWIWLLPVTVISTGLHQVAYALCNRHKQYRAMAMGKISGALVNAVANLGFAVFRPSLFGLVFSGIAGSMVSAVTFIRYCATGERPEFSAFSRERVWDVAGTYRKFLFFSLPADLVNVAAQHAPIFLLSSFFGPAVAGVFALSQRVLGMPVVMLSSTVLDVFRQRASADYATDGNCSGIFRKTLIALATTSLLPFLVLLVGSPWLFSYLFGADWRIAGEYAQILTPMFYLRFVISPLTYVIYIAGYQILDLCSNSVLFIGAVLSIVAGQALASPRTAIMLYCLVYCIMYSIYGWIAYRVAQGENRASIERSS